MDDRSLIAGAVKFSLSESTKARKRRYSDGGINDTKNSDPQQQHGPFFSPTQGGGITKLHAQTEVKLKWTKQDNHIVPSDVSAQTANLKTKLEEADWSPLMTDNTTRKTWANVAYGGVISIDSSSDEGDDTQSIKNRSDANNKLLLVYPFYVDEAMLSAAAADLKELGGDLLGLDQAEVSARGQLVEGYVAEEIKKPMRTHYVTIREDDKERLRPGQFLNDALVDFWMRW